MRYKCVKLEVKTLPKDGRSKRRRTEREWTVSVHLEEGDRVETETCPNSLGFYYYPETMPDQEAFEKLKQHMLSTHEAEIARLTEARDKLAKLELGNR
jgi:hypothetical protein